MDNTFLHNKKLLLVDDAPVLKLDSCTVDFSRAEVDKGGEVLPLTAMEHKLLETVAADLSVSGISEKTMQELNRNRIWAMYLDTGGQDFSAFRNGHPVGRPVNLSVRGELSEIADSVNQASQVLSRQNQARANWISGVSHDIRTPLSIIMGYAGRIACDHAASKNIQQEAEIIRAQSAKIQDLVQDLNLVSQLEYEMQPLHKEPVRLSKLLRSYAVDLLNAGIPEKYLLETEISKDAENVVIECDARLISRAVGNLVQNSIRHNPKGCSISLRLACPDTSVFLIVADDGVGLSVEKLRELEEKPHYMESTDERLDLRHGLGLLLVRQIVKAHGGTMKMESAPQSGYKTIIIFERSPVRSG